MTNDELIEHFGLPKYRKIESPVPFVKPGELSFTQWHAVRDVDALLAHVQHHYLPEKTRHYERLHPANTPALSE